MERSDSYLPIHLNRQGYPLIEWTIFPIEKCFIFGAVKQRIEADV